MTRLLRLEFDHTKLEYYTELDAVLLVGTKKPIGSFEEVKSTVSTMMTGDNDLTEEERQRIDSLEKLLNGENGFSDSEDTELESTSRSLEEVASAITTMMSASKATSCNHEDRQQHGSCNRPVKDLTKHIMELNIHSIPPQVSLSVIILIILVRDGLSVYHWSINQFEATHHVCVTSANMFTSAHCPHPMFRASYFIYGVFVCLKGSFPLLYLQSWYNPRCLKMCPINIYILLVMNVKLFSNLNITTCIV